MSTPYDPGRPEDRPSDQPGYPSGPPQQPYPPAQPEQGGYAGGPPGGQYGDTPQAGQYGGGQYGNAPQYGGEQYGNAPPQYGGGQYGNAPQYAEPYGGARTPGTPPREVLRAVQLMFARVVLGVLSAILTFASAGAIKDSIRNSNTNLTEDQVNSAYGVLVGGTILFGLVFAVLYVLLALQVRKGKNWARIVTWVLAALGVLGGLLGLLGNGTGLEKVLGLVILLVDLGIIVLLAMRPSNEYFAAQKAPRY